jgi:N-acetyl-anhydromuramyl-L-alanine amidase AmpD
VGIVHRTAALADLARIGYCVTAATEQVALAAFQRRFRPERWDGLLDGETSLRLRQVRMAVEAAQAIEETRRRSRFN